ncbi:hypothetical protein U1Q18_018997 [Sarracenia purpurea var. burkii]
MKNKAAFIHKAAKEMRALIEAKRGEDLLKAEEIAAKHRATGTGPKKLLGVLEFEELSLEMRIHRVGKALSSSCKIVGAICSWFSWMRIQQFGLRGMPQLLNYCPAGFYSAMVLNLATFVSVSTAMTLLFAPCCCFAVFRCWLLLDLDPIFAGVCCRLCCSCGFLLFVVIAAFAGSDAVLLKFWVFLVLSFAEASSIL